MQRELKEWFEQDKGWDSKYLTKTTKASKTSTYSVGIHAVWNKGSRLATALNGESSRVLDYERIYEAAESTSDRMEQPAVREPSHTLAVPHFKEWLGFTPNLDWASRRMDPLGINLAIQPDKISNQLLGDRADIQDEKQLDTEGLSIGGLLDHQAVGSMLAKIEDVPLGTSLAGFVTHFTYCSNEEVAKILASPDWQAAFNLWSSLPGVNDYHHWISYISHSSARSAYHQEATNMWLFQAQTKQAKRLHDLSVMVPRTSDTHETQRRYLASQAFCWLEKRLNRPKISGRPSMPTM